ncbi:MAG: hypothetical protein KAQ94_04585 [Arcobacteraceae bacterium]|nr:hypothetical protein [Arcobacteraceae bacterium]
MLNQMINQDTTIEELAALVCEELKKYNIEVVLSGGSCMELYSNSEFSSYDMDLIMRYSSKQHDVNKAMEDLGFKQEKISRYFKHPSNAYFVEFPDGPVAVGDEFIKEFDTRTTKFGELKLLKVEDCIKDRLCAYVYHYDNICFDQAVSVAKNNDIDYEELKRWAEAESGNDMVNAVNELINR